MGLVDARTLSSLLLATAFLMLLLGPSEASVRRQNERGGRSRRIRLNQCQALPRFIVDGVEPLTLTRGQVTLAALLTNTCGFCLSQATRLQNLSSAEGNGDVRMMIINGGDRPPPGQEGPLGSRVSFPVYHDDSAGTIWSQVFGGRKDDIFLIDRCGQLTYRIPFPYSYLGYNYVSRAIERTRSGEVCPCQHSQDPHDRMMEDAPSLGGSGRRSMGSRIGGNRQGYMGAEGYGRGGRGGRVGGRSGGGRRDPPSYRYRNQNRQSRCARNDRLCRDMRRDRRRYNLYARLHGLKRQSDMSEEQVLRYFSGSRRGWGGGMGPAA